MHRKNPEVDIVKNVLDAALAAYPQSAFIQSLSRQYMERGGLSKKQMEGLYQKVENLDTLPSKWLATMEAEILKKPTRYKSAPPAIKPLYEKDERIGNMINTIMAKYPLHKRVTYFQARYDNNQPLSASELSELEKFFKLLAK